MDTSSSVRCQFKIEIPRRKLVDISLIVKANPGGKNDIDLMRITRRRLDF